MKGIINIEFFLAVAVFLSTIFFIILTLTNSLPQFHNEALLSSLRAKTYAASQILVFDEGSPANWNTLPLSEVNRFGLSTAEKYNISSSKITALASLCNTANYDRIRSILLGSDNLIVIINITNVETGVQMLYCSPSTATLVFPKASITRYAILSSGDRISIRVDVT